MQLLAAAAAFFPLKSNYKPSNVMSKTCGRLWKKLQVLIEFGNYMK